MIAPFANPLVRIGVAVALVIAIVLWFDVISCSRQKAAQGKQDTVSSAAVAETAKDARPRRKFLGIF